MNIKNRLQKITIILAIFLILFNFMGSTMVYATITISDDVITWIKSNCDSIVADGAATDVAKAFDVDGVTGIVIDNGNFVVQYSGNNWEKTQETITNNLKKTYMGNDAAIFFTKGNVSHTSNSNNSANTNNTNNSNKNKDTSDDSVVNWILNKYNVSLSAPTAAQAVKNAILGTDGVTGISIKNEKLHVEYNGQWNTIKGNIESKLRNTYLSQSDIDIFFNADRFEYSGTEKEVTDDEYNNMSEKEQFFYYIGKNMDGIDDAVKEQYYSWYTSGQENNMGQKSIEVTKDENGNITNITVNLDQDQANATNNSHVIAGSNKRDKFWDSEAEETLGLSSLLIVPTVGIVVTVIDGIYKVFQNFIIGDSTLSPSISSIAGSIKDALPWFGNHIVVDKDSTEASSLIEQGSQASAEEKSNAIHIQYDEIYHLPTMVLTPAAIFEGKVAALNGNFFDTSDASSELGGESMSTVSQLKSVVSGWYVTLRNIAVVGLLSVLIYIGIRIIIASSNNDKAKYKQFFMDWIVALCLIFFMHYIMSFLMTITDSITEMLAKSGTSSSGSYVSNEVLVSFGENATSNGKYMYTSFAGVARMRLQYDGNATKLGYAALYICFVGYTIYFSFVYLKRILYLSFFTMIAPLVALTYPIDKMKDGKAQAFNYWFKEYVFYSMLQPLHLFLYTVFVKTAISLASKNMIYAIVAMAFIIPAEKIVKSMFGIQGKTEGALGGFVGATVASHMFGAMKQRQKPPKPPKEGVPAGTQKPRIASNPSAVKEMDAFDYSDVQNAGASTIRTEDNNAELQSGGATATLNTPQGANVTGDNNLPEGNNPNGTQGANEAVPTANLTQEQREVLNAQASASNTRANAGNNNSGTTRRRAIRDSSFGRAVGRRWTAAGGLGGIAAGAAKSAGKGIVKGYARAAGTVGLATVGLGLGMVGGDLNNSWQGLAAGAGVGAYLGGNIGQKATNAISDTLNGNNEISRFASEVYNGSPEESAREHAKREYRNDRRNLERILQDHQNEDGGKGWTIKQARNYAEQEYDMMYNSKTQDVDLADKAIALKDHYVNDLHMSEDSAKKKAAGILNATKYYDRSTFTSSKKLAEAKKAMTSRVQEQKGLNAAQAKVAVDAHFSDIAKLHGIEKMPKNTRNQTTTQQNETQNTSRDNGNSRQRNTQNNNNSNNNQ